MNSTGYLRNYIQQNPNTPLEDILNDEEILEEIPVKDEKVLEYFANHIQEMIQILSNQINEMTNFKLAFKFPFIVSEVLSIDHPIITNSLLDQNKNYIMQLLSLMSSQNIETTIPGYINRILTSHIGNNQMITFIQESFEEIFNCLISNIDSDSFMNLLSAILSSAIECDKDKYLKYIQKLFDLLNSSYDISAEKIENICNVIISLSHKGGDDVNEYIFVNCYSTFIALLKQKTEYGMNDISTDIENDFESKKYSCFLKLIANLLLMTIINSTENSENEKLFNELVLVSAENIQPKRILNSNTIKIIENNIHNAIDVIYDISQKIKKFYSKVKFVPFNNNEGYNKNYPCVSFSYLVMLDIITILAYHQRPPSNLISILKDLIIDLKTYPYNSLFNIKVIKLFEIILKENLVTEKDLDIPMRKLDDLIREITLDKSQVENGVLKQNENVYAIKLYLLLSEFLKGNQTEAFKEYEAIISKDLFKDQVQTGTVGKNEDEETYEPKKDIHDTEAFIFTTMKTMEASKKVSNKLKMLEELK